jgi:hypothetical protein
MTPVVLPVRRLRAPDSGVHGGDVMSLERKRMRGVRRVGVLALLVSSCHTWPSRPLAVVNPGANTIRVVTDGGRVRTVLDRGMVVGDSVVGRLNQIDTLQVNGWARLHPGDGRRTAIPVSRIVRLEVRELDGRRTFGWLVPIVVLVALLAASVAMLPAA